MCCFATLMLIALGVLNARSGRQDSVWLAIRVSAILLVSLAMLLTAPKDLGGKIYFWMTAVVLAYLRYFGYVHGRTFRYWAYVFPPILFFLIRPRWALIGMLLFGIYASLAITPFTAPIDVYRFGMSYLLLVGFMYTYALLEERAAAMLRYQSDHDGLTNCLNRRTFNETMQSIEQGDGAMVACGFLLIDIDRFKTINDSLGHLVGDRVMTQVAAIIGRELDTGMGLYRYGGEEFAVVVPGADPQAALALAERLRSAVERGDFGEPKVTISIGVAPWRREQGGTNHALDAADRALYQAKHGGRNRVVLAPDQAKSRPAVSQTHP